LRTAVLESERSTVFFLKLNWEKLASMTTDIGRNMYGSKTGTVRRICKEVMHLRSSNPTAVHCIIYQKALFCKILSQKMKEVTDTFI